MARVEINIELNRVEGDLEIGLTLEDGVVVEARTIGTLYRGFEQIMIGRSPRDAMVITPRICGICSTAHLYASVLALENLWQLPVPPNAIRIRNLCLMAEGIQSDLRQTFLFFAPDFCNPRYASHPLFSQMLADFEPFRGRIHRECIKISRRLVEIVALFGGQWPHSSYMLPGGVVAPPDSRKILTSLAILDEAQRWIEDHIFGVNLERWLAIDNADIYFQLLEETAHANSALGLMTRFAHSIDLHEKGRGTPHYLSFGAWCDPENWAPSGGQHLLPAGIYDATQQKTSPLDPALITEHVRHSWFRPYEGGKHPWEGETVPDFQPGTDRYTWAKAPRYEDKVMQTGPLAKLVIGGDRLIIDLLQKYGSSAWLRQFARVHHCAVQLFKTRQTLHELASQLDEPHFIAPSKAKEIDGQGCGMIMAARGALGHWIKVEDGLIKRYQIVTPTAWNASPRDSNGVPGHWEQSLVGLTVSDPDDPVEIGHIIRSHDPCLVCTVHMTGSGKRLIVGA